jgi:hypothetical protein
MIALSSCTVICLSASAADPCKGFYGLSTQMELTPCIAVYSS